MNSLKERLTTKIGPLPVFAWIGIATVGVFLFMKRGASGGIAGDYSMPTQADGTSMDEQTDPYANWQDYIPVVNSPSSGQQTGTVGAGQQDAPTNVTHAPLQANVTNTGSSTGNVTTKTTTVQTSKLFGLTVPAGVATAIRDMGTTITGITGGGANAGKDFMGNVSLPSVGTVGNTPAQNAALNIQSLIDTSRKLIDANPELQRQLRMANVTEEQRKNVVVGEGGILLFGNGSTGQTFRSVPTSAGGVAANAATNNISSDAYSRQAAHELSTWERPTAGGD